MGFERGDVVVYDADEQGAQVGRKGAREVTDQAAGAAFAPEGAFHGLHHSGMGHDYPPPVPPRP